MSSLGSICYFIHRAARAITRKSLSSDMKNLQKWLNAFLKRKKQFFFSLSLSLPLCRLYYALLAYCSVSTRCTKLQKANHKKKSTVEYDAHIIFVWKAER